MSVIRVGVQAPAGSSGQFVDIDGPSATITSITNASGESIQYSLDGGTSWTTLASAAVSGSLGAVLPGQIRLRKVSSGSYPAPVDVDATINGLTDAYLTAAQTAAVQAATDAAAPSGNVSTVAGAPLSGKCAGLLIDGDSLAAQNNNELSPLTGATQTGGVATATITGATGIPGMRLKLGNHVDPLWNGFFTVATVSGTTCTFAIDPAAAASATTIRSQGGLSLMSQRTASGDYVWAEMVNGVNYTLMENVAYGGRVMTEILADAPTTIGRYRNCLIDFNGGTNDPKNGVTNAASSAALEAYIVLARTYGHVVLLNTVAPLAGSANTTAVQQLTLSLNKEIRRLALKYDCPLYDKYAALVDPASAHLLAGNFDTSDNIHPTPTACKIAGTAKAGIYEKFVPTRRVNLPATTSDTIGTINTSSNIMDGFFAGTAGTGGLGSVATGWVLAPTTVVVTGSKGTGAVGATQILTLSGASGSFTFTGVSVHSQLVAGASYELVGKLTTANFAAGIRVAVLIQTDKGEIRALATRSASTPLPLNGAMVFRSDPFTVLAGSVPTSFQPKLVVATTAVPGGTETVTTESWAINRLS